jgi:hypothetical protein
VPNGVENVRCGPNAVARLPYVCEFVDEDILASLRLLHPSIENGTDVQMIVVFSLALVDNSVIAILQPQLVGHAD